MTYDPRTIDWSTVKFTSYPPCPECDRLAPLDCAVIAEPERMGLVILGWPDTVYLLYSCCVDWAHTLGDGR